MNGVLTDLAKKIDGVQIEVGDCLWSDVTCKDIDLLYTLEVTKPETLLEALSVGDVAKIGDADTILKRVGVLENVITKALFDTDEDGLPLTISYFGLDLVDTKTY